MISPGGIGKAKLGTHAMTMIYSYPLSYPGRLIKRYKRFLADVVLEEGKTVTAFCPNSGSMTGLVEPGTPARLSLSQNPARKTRYTLEMLRPMRAWVGVNTLLATRLAESLLTAGLVSPFPHGFDALRREVASGNSRIDILLEKGWAKTYIEAKSVTLRAGDEARFPDAVTLRGKKHLETLVRLRKDGHGACMLYLVQRGDCRCFAPADDIDPGYAKALRRAVEAGVRVYAVGLEVMPEGVFYTGSLPFCPR